MKYFTFILLFVLFCMPMHAKDRNYAVALIPQSLRTNADAVIRYHLVEKEISSDSRISTQETFAVTIFNKSAQSLGYFYEVYDKLSRVSGYSLKLYNKMGNLVDKAKSSDFNDVKAYDGFSLFDDNRLIFNKTFSSDFPYTIEFSFHRTDKQTLNLGSWFPVLNYGIAVEQAMFSIKVDSNLSIRYLEHNLPKPVSIATQKDKKIYSWSLNNFEAIKKEPFMPDADDIFPKVRLALNHFDYDGFAGNQSDWNSFGLWIYDLIKNQDELPLETATKIRQMVDTLETKSQKVAALYAYLQDNTRYVSIQLGIGGYQPFDAGIVDKTKYGDCKGLSNYMKALLKAADIESDYAIIRAGKYAGQIQTDFPSNQFNHAILCVPDINDTIWLECTSQKKPFGFLGSFTDNRNCLLITQNGGKMVKTPKYPQKNNKRQSTLTCTIDSLGNATITDNSEFTGLQYEYIEKFFHMSPKEQKEELYEELNLPNVNIRSFNFSSDLKSIPTAKVNLEFTVNKLGNTNGDRMFIPVNPFNPMDYIPEQIKNRKAPITLRQDESTLDSIIFELPEKYSIEFIPEPFKLETAYGVYERNISILGEKLIYTRSFTKNPGTYAPNAYEQVRDYFKEIANADKAKLVLIHL